MKQEMNGDSKNSRPKAKVIAKAVLLLIGLLVIASLFLVRFHGCGGEIAKASLAKLKLQSMDLHVKIYHLTYGHLPKDLSELLKCKSDEKYNCPSNSSCHMRSTNGLLEAKSTATDHTPSSNKSKKYPTDRRASTKRMQTTSQDAAPTTPRSST